jgi:hypothetical protein
MKMQLVLSESEEDSIEKQRGGEAADTLRPLLRAKIASEMAHFSSFCWGS